MPTIVYVDPDGSRRTVEAATGATVMGAAVQNGVTGIVAECGGSLSCASCHVYVEDDWISVVGVAQDELECDLLDGAMSERGPGSRLSCQLTVTASFDGLTVRIPADQI